MNVRKLILAEWDTIVTTLVSPAVQWSFSFELSMIKFYSEWQGSRNLLDQRIEKTRPHWEIETHWPLSEQAMRKCMAFTQVVIIQAHLFIWSKSSKTTNLGFVDCRNKACILLIADVPTLSSANKRSVESNQEEHSSRKYLLMSPINTTFFLHPLIVKHTECLQGNTCQREAGMPPSCWAMVPHPNLITHSHLVEVECG